MRGSGVAVAPRRGRSLLGGSSFFGVASRDVGLGDDGPSNTLVPFNADLTSVPQDLDDAPELLEVLPQLCRRYLEDDQDRTQLEHDCEVDVPHPYVDPAFKHNRRTRHGPEAQSNYTYRSSTEASRDAENCFHWLRMDYRLTQVVHIRRVLALRELGVKGWTVEERTLLPEDRVQVACGSLTLGVFLEADSLPGAALDARKPQALGDYIFLSRQRRHHWTGPRFCGKRAGRTCLSGRVARA